MLYLNEEDIKKIGINWSKSVDVLEEVIKCLGNEDYSQPLKPYLRFKDKKNRIIAMPAYVGGDFDMAGIKWIAGFPDNIYKGLPRANSVIILNDTDTGVPISIINSSLISIIRTVALNGLMIRKWKEARNNDNWTIGVIGRGPIGQNHMKLRIKLFNDKISKIKSFSLRPADENTTSITNKIEIVNTWEDAYLDSDIVITCSVPQKPYINKLPKKGALILNCSLRDFGSSIYKEVKKSIIVDSWDNVCRGNTDIDAMHKKYGLQEYDVKTIVDVVYGAMKDYKIDETIMINSMGMGVFDVGMATYYYRKSLEMNLGKEL